MRDALLMGFGMLALTGLIFVHVHGWTRRRVLALTVFFDVLVGSLAAVATWSSGTFQTWMQEDGWAEWGTVYAFGIAAILIGLRLRRWRKDAEIDETLPPLGLFAIAAFCVFVAGEEISWGQRLFAFEPPEIFLEANFQQELNVHNLLTKKEFLGFRLDSRFLVAVIAIAYGCVLPGLRRWDPVKQLRGVLETVAPPWELAPWFLVVALVELSYPAKLAGEACELVLGMLFFATAMVHGKAGTLEAAPIAPGRAAALLIAPLAIGAATQPLVSRLLYGADQALVAQTETELRTLRDDLLADGVMQRKLRRKRRVHKRLFTAVQARYFDLSGGVGYLDGEMTPATKGALQPRRDRKGYFLDPWNNPYWILATRKGRRAALYSFGPNRRRDTKVPKKRIRKDFEAKGDDIFVLLSTSASRP